MVVILILSSRTPDAIGYSQYTLQLGKTNNQVEVLNFLKSDSGLVIPTKPILSPYYGPAGQIYFNQYGDGGFYYHTGVLWKRLISVTDSVNNFVTPAVLKDSIGVVRGLIPTNNNQLSNGAAYITAAAIAGKVNYSDSNVTFATPKKLRDSSVSIRSAIPTNNNQLSNGSAYITGITAALIVAALTYTPVTNARTLTIAGTSQDMSADRTFSPTTTNIPEGTSLYYTNARARSAISLTTTGTGPASYSSSTGVLNVPIPYVPSINAVSRTINSATYTPSATLQAMVTYTIQISCTATIGSNASGQVTFQYSINGGGAWADAGVVKNSNTVSLALALNLVNIQVASITATIPSGALCRLVPSTTGTTVITYVSGVEVY